MKSCCILTVASRWLLSPVVTASQRYLCHEWICFYFHISITNQKVIKVLKVRASPRDLSVFLPPPQAMVETVNNLLQPRAQAAWRELPTSEQLHSATLLLDTVETGAFMLADNLLKTDTVQETTDNIREYILWFAPRLPDSVGLWDC